MSVHDLEPSYPLKDMYLEIIFSLLHLMSLLFWGHSHILINMELFPHPKKEKKKVSTSCSSYSPLLLTFFKKISRELCVLTVAQSSLHLIF